MSKFISLTDAKEMVARYRKRKPEMLQAEYRNSLTIAETFDRSQFDKLLSKDGCTGLRIYYGMSEDLRVHAIIVGVNAKNQDMVALQTTVDNENMSTDGDSADDEEIIEDGAPCPNNCPEDSPLYP